MTTTHVQRTQTSLYTQQRLLFMTLDPVHIGAGGYRLGRVDMTIAREPGTLLPKIPGTSLAGAARSYAAMQYGKPDAAGQQKKLEHGRGKNGCPIIYTFGTSTDSNKSDGMIQAGTVSIGDAHILFFPVHSMAGPIWVSTQERIIEALGPASLTLPSNITIENDKVVTSLDWDQELNLGWLLFEAQKGLKITPPAVIVDSTAWKAISDRIALVTDKLFSQIVNSNLEVRTSVSINPETGAAEQGALFTYEAIPRTAWLWSDVIEDDYKRMNGSNTIKVFPVKKRCKVTIMPKTDGKQEAQYEENAGEDLGEEWEGPLDVVRSGMRLIKYLGVGGMGTRGFGRMQCVADWQIDDGDNA